MTEKFAENIEAINRLADSLDALAEAIEKEGQQGTEKIASYRPISYGTIGANEPSAYDPLTAFLLS